MTRSARPIQGRSAPWYKPRSDQVNLEADSAPRPRVGAAAREGVRISIENREWHTYIFAGDILGSGGQEHHYKYGGPDRKSDPEPLPAHAYQQSERPKPEGSPEDRIKQRCRPPCYLITPVTSRLHMANALKRPHCGSLSLYEIEFIWHCWRKYGVSEAKTRSYRNILSGI